MAKKNNQLDSLNLTVVALVAVVAIVGLVALVMNANGVAKIATSGTFVEAQDMSAESSASSEEWNMDICMDKCLAAGESSCSQQCEIMFSGSNMVGLADDSKCKSVKCLQKLDDMPNWCKPNCKK